MQIIEEEASAIMNSTEIAVKSQQDLLNREEFVSDIMSIIESLSKEKKTCTFSINGSWGCGKSFIIDTVKCKLHERNCLAISYNAWENDFYEEPLVAILASLVDNIQALEKAEVKDASLLKKLKALGRTALGLINIMAHYSTGVDVNSVIRNISNVDKKDERDPSRTLNLVENKTLLKAIINEICSKLNELTKNITIVFLVDELDRCMPDYAIKVLERFHHIFENVVNCQAVIAIDKRQLESAVKSVYGEKTNIEGYLRKFISFELELTNGELSEEFSSLFVNYQSMFSYGYDHNEVSDNCNELIKYVLSGIDIRTQKKLIEKAELIHKLFISEENVPLDMTIFCFEIFWTVMVDYYKIYNGDTMNIIFSNKDFISNVIENFDGKVQNDEWKKSMDYLSNIFTELNVNHCDNALGSEGYLYAINIEDYYSFMLCGVCRLNTNADLRVKHHKKWCTGKPRLDVFYNKIEKFDKYLRIIK